MVCLVETWACEAITSSPYPDKFPYFEYSKATKEKSKGRGSGGILIMYKSKFELIDKTNLWIAIKVKDIVFVAVCLRPSLDDRHCIVSLSDFLGDLVGLDDFGRVIVLGDFNARTANLGDTDEVVLADTVLEIARTSMDDTCNRRGSMLSEAMQDLGLVLLNGRTKGDIPGRYTFINRNGKSVVDLVWVSSQMLQEVSKLSIKYCADASDHAICLLCLRDFLEPDDVILKDASLASVKLVWSQDRAMQYGCDLDDSPRLYFDSEDGSELYENLAAAIVEAAQAAGMQLVVAGEDNAKRAINPGLMCNADKQKLQ